MNNHKNFQHIILIMMLCLLSLFISFVLAVSGIGLNPLLFFLFIVNCCLVLFFMNIINPQQEIVRVEKSQDRFNKFYN